MKTLVTYAMLGANFRKAQILKKMYVEPEAQQQVQLPKFGQGKGLKKLRANYKQHTVLKKECPNCGCKRYNPCTCLKKD